MTDIQKWAIDAVYEEKSATGTYYLCADVDPVIEKLETENSVQRHQIAYLESELAKSKENARITLSCNDDLKVRLSELEAIVEQIQLAANTNGFDSIQALIEHLPFLANAETEISRLCMLMLCGLLNQKSWKANLFMQNLNQHKGFRMVG
jgi:hypothetical protein